MTRKVKQGSCPTFPSPISHYNRPSSHWPCSVGLEAETNIPPSAHFSRPCWSVYRSGRVCPGFAGSRSRPSDMNSSRPIFMLDVLRPASSSIKRPSPQAPTLLGGVRFIPWHRRHVFFRGMITGPKDSLWVYGITKSHREQGLDYREAEEQSGCSSLSNSLWQGWSWDWCIVLVEIPLTRFEECWPLQTEYLAELP